MRWRVGGWNFATKNTVNGLSGKLRFKWEQSEGKLHENGLKFY
jgi:hypothetical protein